MRYPSLVFFGVGNYAPLSEVDNYSFKFQWWGTSDVKQSHSLAL